MQINTDIIGELVEELGLLLALSFDLYIGRMQKFHLGNVHYCRCQGHSSRSYVIWGVK